MRKFTKHILSVLLCVALCCAALSAPAFAASGAGHGGWQLYH
jgi:hypothetical protein